MEHDHDYNYNYNNKYINYDDGTYITNAIFNKTNGIFIVWFLAIYILSYFLLGNLLIKDIDSYSFQQRLSRGIDLIFLVFLIILFVAVYFFNTQSNRENIIESLLNNYNIFINDPKSIISIFFFIIFMYVLFYLFRIPLSNESKSFTVLFIETITWITFVIICFVDFFKYILNISLTDLFKDAIIFNYTPHIHIKGNTTNPITGNTTNPITKNTTKSITINNDNNLQNLLSNLVSGNLTQEKKLIGNLLLNNFDLTSTLKEPEIKKEVFNIANNLYTYDDAQAVCSAYGANIATYEQIENSYNDGAEWCNYGWSDNQMAYFPTQKSSWDKYQKIKGHENDCGRPGVNGGYMSNPNLLFGVNCYGVKPDANPYELNRMTNENNYPDDYSDPSIQKTPEELIRESKIKYFKENSDKLFTINSFNRTKWHEY